MVLLEEAHVYPNIVTTNAVSGEIDVSAIGISDTRIDPLGARGIGEIGITGPGAAIFCDNTGKRVRDLPITPHKFFA